MFDKLLTAAVLSMFVTLILVGVITVSLIFGTIIWIMKQVFL